MADKPRFRKFKQKQGLGDRYYIHENTNISDIRGLHVPREALKQIQRNSNNNLIGAYQFAIEGGGYNTIITVPKFCDIYNCSQEDMDLLFVKYMSLYRDLVKEGYKGKRQLDDNIRDFNLNDVTDLDGAMKIKYVQSLKEIKRFFHSHKSVSNKRNNFHSSSISNAIDIKKNILEINKSKIHQYNEVEFNYSEIANVAYVCLNHFRKQVQPMLGACEAIDKEIKQLSGFLKRHVVKRFKIDNKYFQIHSLVRPNIRKLFKNSSDKNKLYTNLLTLVCGDTIDSADKKITNLISLYFSPEIMFEMHVERLLNQSSDYSVKNQPIIQSNLQLFNEDGQESEPTVLSTHDNRPDHLVSINDNDLVIVLDSKWKKITQYSQIVETDVLKLVRDRRAISIKEEYKNKRVLQGLVYPELPANLEEFKSLSFDYDSKESFFILSLPLFNQDQSEVNVANLAKLHF
ncbi:hypothetical protein DZ860_06970 [Vibrio sinensis]|uniref:Uncharacterized protein n=1 Tax=Vibrio sinensis TaxID=2302434 RepID=A0A3A6QK52_9VIBR|nr:hypothetical protein [Vibrio sinensis]RJX72893.1 hypothetical protein DZ860_06970 [Vibrio sinensis]